MRRRLFAWLLIAVLLPVYVIASVVKGVWWFFAGDDGPTVRW